MVNITLPSWMTGRKAAPKAAPMDVLTRMEPVTRIASLNDNPNTAIAPRKADGVAMSDYSAADAMTADGRDIGGADARAQIGDRSKGWSLPFIGHLPLDRQLKALGVLAGTLLTLTLLAFGLYVLEAGKLNGHVAAASELKVLSQNLAIHASQAQLGQADAFKRLAQTRDAYMNMKKALADGGETEIGSIDALQTEGQRAALQKLTTLWSKAGPNVDDIVKNEGPLKTLGITARFVNDAAPGLQAATDQLAQLLSSVGLREQTQAAQLSMLTQRVAKNVNGLLASEVDPEVAFGLGKDVATFRDVIKALREGSDELRVAAVKDPQASAALAEVAKRFADVDKSVSDLLRSTPGLVAGKQAASALADETNQLASGAQELSGVLGGAANPGSVALCIAIGLGALTLLTAALIAKVLNDDAKRRGQLAEQENRRNQEAILRLLNEMGNLADGDLTVKASVTEDVTGAIADSINFTVDELRGVVTGINSTTDQVNSATQEAQRISVRLFEESQRQSSEIQRASSLVLSMAQSINDVSAAAAQSARVAQTSLAASEQGTVAVQNQISSMNEIRGQIQETAKRIKRLGESSQEIGQITELIGDITQQTNVLALNAAIQAASAGDAGRGFSVVAEEVQRLAERSGEATKQIEAIVKTIQADTQDAVVAMERSTQGVVEGTKLSDAAGAALNDVRRVSRELADLISNISAQTQRQATSVSEVTRGMQDILRVSEDASRSTQLTTTQIDKLTALARSLRESVAGFKV
jgi:twitching motility protein PilJ